MNRTYFCKTKHNSHLKIAVLMKKKVIQAKCIESELISESYMINLYQDYPTCYLLHKSTINNVLKMKCCK